MRVPVDIYTDDRLPLDEKAVDQLCDGAALPGVVRAVGTPDIHCGYGVPIGCVLGMSGTVVPAAAGYDINCGMQMLLTNVQASSAEAAEMARRMRHVIPLGEGRTNLALGEEDFRAILAGGLAALGDVQLERYPFCDSLEDALPVGDVAAVTQGAGSLNAAGSTLSRRAIDRGMRQLGTLGGGNHFIEFQQVTDILRPDTAKRWGVEEGQLAIMIHSGSRGFGHEVASRYLKGGRMLVLDAESREGADYLDEMSCAANFAFVNRYMLGALLCTAVRRRRPDVRFQILADISHNMVSREAGLLVHRKGATPARGPSLLDGQTGQPVLIPGSMGTASYVLEGSDGSAATLHSVNHGAGRVMGRREALGRKKGGRVIREGAISEEMFRNSMAGIELICENPRTIREEAPQAYKDIEVVVEVVDFFDLAKPVCRLRPLAVLKG